MNTIVHGIVRAATLTLILTSLLSVPSLTAAAPPAHGLPFKPWINGVSADEPQMQVQRYDDDTFVIRQSIRTNFEGPFLYLLFGSDRALLIDSGAGGLKVRPTIDRVIAEWAARHHRRSIPLVISHSHSHGDHHQGDAEFQDRSDTAIVGLSPKDVADFFKIADWPNQIATYDLGGRVLDVIPTPGHQPAHIMIFDRKTRLLFSGDSLGPYRLYVPTNQAKTYRDSIDRVAAFTRDKHVSWILGAHIEMTTRPGELIPDEAPSHPDEHLLEISYANLPELQMALHEMGDNLVQQAHRDFVIFPKAGNATAESKLPDPIKAGVADKLYRLDCGHSLANDESVWTPGENVGRDIEFSSTCWLIKHGREWLLWDTGVPESSLNDPKGWSTLPKLIVYHLDKSITAQLAEIGLKPDDIGRVAISHTHGDHIGNMALFPNASILMQRGEYNWIHSPNGPNDNVNQLMALARKLLGTPKRLQLIDGDSDVFGDGSVTLLATPGHTPGHESLLVHLKNSGFIVLSGDVVHLQENFAKNIVPTLNTDKAQSIASMERIRQVLATYQATLFINHDKSQSDKLKLLPAFYD